MSRVTASCSRGVAGLSLILQQTRLAAAYGLAIVLLKDNVQHVKFPLSRIFASFYG
jgi:hypothetical protein